MDCAVCQIRSSVGFCIECKDLLCEVCGVTCAHCGKMVCPEHLQVSRSGRKFCGPCMERRKELKKKRALREDLKERL